MKEIKHFTITVTGRVQGVFYRRYTMEKAQTLGLKGFVRNEKDGSVVIKAEGSPSALQALADWCRDGSPESNVEDVKVSTGPIEGFSDFRIDR